jgi:hypothetical protein
MRRTARVTPRTKAAYVSAVTLRSATQVPWKNVVDTTRQPFFSAIVIHGSCNTVASTSPRSTASSRSLELTVAAQVVIASRGIAPSSISRPAYAVPLP